MIEVNSVLVRIQAQSTTSPTTGDKHSMAHIHCVYRADCRASVSKFGVRTRELPMNPKSV